MTPLFIQYPKCSTCRRAAAWLREHGIQYTDRNIVDDKPSTDELKEWIRVSGLPVARFFNTSGLVYRSLGLKDIIKTSSDEVLIGHLASNGKLIKRPIFVSEKCILLGFAPKEWNKLLM